MKERTAFIHKFRWVALLCLALPMFGSYFFDDIFSTVSHLFHNPEILELGWDMGDYGHYKSAYSLLCVFGGLIVCGMLLDKWGVRVTGSLFVGLMLIGAAVVRYAISESFHGSVFFGWMAGFCEKPSVSLAYMGCTVFGLGSEIAGVAVNRSISKWFKDGNLALAMGLQLALARLGTASAMLLVPSLVNPSTNYITFGQTASGASVGLTLIMVGVIVWGIFVALDYRADRIEKSEVGPDAGVRKEFHIRDAVRILGNKDFLLVALLCVTFYCCIVSFRKFASAIVIPRFGVDVEVASVMVSMIPFGAMIFAPLFGAMVDRIGRGTKVMIFGACLVAAAHLLLAFAPPVHFLGYLSIALLGLGYSLLPAAMWPSVPKIVPDKVLGTAFSLLYWIQNIGLMSVPVAVGHIMKRFPRAVDSAFNAELLFIGISCVAILAAVALSRRSSGHPEMGLDAKNVKFL